MNRMKTRLITASLLAVIATGLSSNSAQAQVVTIGGQEQKLALLVEEREDGLPGEIAVVDAFALDEARAESLAHGLLLTYGYTTGVNTWGLVSTGGRLGIATADHFLEVGLEAQIA